MSNYRPKSDYEERMPLSPNDRDFNRASCRICRFYHAANGWCRRYPPTIVQLPSGALVSYYPVVQTDGWCGEYKPKRSPRNEQ